MLTPARNQKETIQQRPVPGRITGLTVTGRGAEWNTRHVHKYTC
jgi:hypothetical protein